jgi:hypothetical protein
METLPLCPRPILQRDAGAEIGVLAILEGEAMAFQLDSALANHLSRRFESLGLVRAGAREQELRQALNDMNHRLRYALGEYEEPQEPMPVP